jgi:hypothetical protein
MYTLIPPTTLRNEKKQKKNDETKLNCNYNKKKTEKNRIRVNESNNGSPWIKCHKTNDFFMFDSNWFSVS